MLNQLLGRTHNIIYSSRRRSFLGVLTFFRDEYPRHFRRLLPYTLAAIALFAGGVLLGSILTVGRHGFMEELLGPRMVETIHRHQMWTHSIVGMKPQESSRIMTNNLTVTFITFAAGITAGVGTLWLMFFNGLLMGVIATACQQAHMSRDLVELCLPAWIAGAAGNFYCGRSRTAAGQRHALPRPLQPPGFDRACRPRGSSADGGRDSDAGDRRHDRGILFAFRCARGIEVRGGRRVVYVTAAVAFFISAKQAAVGEQFSCSTRSNKQSIDSRITFC